VLIKAHYPVLEYCVALCVRRTGAFTVVILECSQLSTRYNGEDVCAKKFRE